MKKAPLALVLLFVINSSRATTITPGKDPLASTYMIPLPGTDKMISLFEYSRLTVKEYKLLAGRKLSFKERVKFKTSQFVVRKMIRDDGTIRAKRFGFFSKWYWHWGGFALGFLIILGPIIALFFRDEYKWDRFWTSFVVTAALLTLVVSLIGASMGPG